MIRDWEAKNGALQKGEIILFTTSRFQRETGSPSSR